MTEEQIEQELKIMELELELKIVNHLYFKLIEEDKQLKEKYEWLKNKFIKGL